MKKFDVVFIVLCPVIASALSFFFKLNFDYSILLFFGVPSIYLSIRGRKYILKSAIFSLIMSFPLYFMLDFLAHYNGQWFNATIFHSRLLGYLPYEDFLWGFGWVYFMVIFYKFFVDNYHSRSVKHPRLRYYLAFSGSLLVGFFAIYFFAPRFLHIPYFYLMVGLVLGLIPLIWELSAHYSLLSKFFIVAVYFFYLDFIYEIAGLRLGWWTFPGHFIGLIHIPLLAITFPIEEFIVWFCLSTIVFLSYYEFFYENQK